MQVQIDVTELPRAARPAFVSYLDGGRQVFPTDRIADAVRERDLRAAGKIVVRRRPAAEAA